MDPEAFFARIRARRGATQEVEVPPVPPLRTAPTIERFTQALTAIGGKVVPTSRASVVEAITGLAAEHRHESFVSWQTPWLVELAAALVRSGLRELRYPDDPARARAVLDEVNIGIVEADFALAETGTVGLIAGIDRGRLVTALPASTIVLLDPTRLLERLEDVPSFLAKRGAMPSAVTMISGPSRTADIAGQIVTGMHGARQFYVLALTD